MPQSQWTNRHATDKEMQNQSYQSVHVRKFFPAAAIWLMNCTSHRHVVHDKRLSTDILYYQQTSPYNERLRN